MKNTTVTAPKGFLAAGISCGIKISGKKDIGFIACPTGAKAAGVFTTNKVVSAAVTVCKQHIKTGNAEAIVANAGIANACTGKLGLKNAEAMCQTAAQLIDAKANQVLIASTGIIGHQLPMDKISRGIILAAAQLSSSQKTGNDFAQAIMTTDTRCKQAFRTIVIGSAKISIAGTAKGAGMVGPNMATTLCFITTDVDITKPLLQKALKDAVGNSLNKLTVDGHQSTNDTAIILASGLAGNKPIAKADSQYNKFAAALAALTTDLAKQMALDAEGATRMFTIVVNGAASKTDAAKAARAVANYDLVKCAIHGGDPNWGRIIAAVGYSPATVVEEKVDIGYSAPGSRNILWSLKRGQPTKATFTTLCAAVAPKEFDLHINLNLGRAGALMYAADLTEEYVEFNKGDVSDPSSLGG